MSARTRIGKVLRRWADRIDHHGAPRAMGRSFTFEPGRGIVFHEDSKTGCPLYYLGMDDYDRAHRDAGFDNGGILPSGMMMPAEQFDRLTKFTANPAPEYDHAVARLYYPETKPANPVTSRMRGFGIELPIEVLDQARAIAKEHNVMTGVWLRGVVEKAVAEETSAVLEERIPADLNPWAGAAVLGLHNHTAEQACDDTCTTYGEGPTI